jgi:DNA-directed RNA polymerase subunit M/transcription elongation factor TFIIS
MYHFKINSVRTAVESAQAQIDKANTKLAKLIFDAKAGNLKTSDRTVLTCTKCGKGSQIRKVRYSKWLWYEKPYSCMAGDMWHFGGYLIECPKCGYSEKVHKPRVPTSNLDVAEYKTLERILVHGIKCEDNMEK